MITCNHTYGTITEHRASSRLNDCSNSWKYKLLVNKHWVTRQQNIKLPTHRRYAVWHRYQIHKKNIWTKEEINAIQWTIGVLRRRREKWNLLADSVHLCKKLKIIVFSKRAFSQKTVFITVNKKMGIGLGHCGYGDIIILYSHHYHNITSKVCLS